jgi:hypothetical protein
VSFHQHPSQQMVGLFKQKPYQGQRPEHAKIIFLGSDANYSSTISNHRFFSHILEYHEDGVRFWQTHGKGKHHPFLLDGPNGYPFDKRMDGVPYHRNFNKIGLSPLHAPDISFLELLDVPTSGIKSEDKEKFFSLVSASHIDYIDRLIQSERPKLVLVSDGVLRDMRDIKRRARAERRLAFPWLPHKTSTGKYRGMVGGSEVIEIPHFSAYQIHAFLPELQAHLNRYLGHAIS